MPWFEPPVQVNLCQKLLFLHQLTHNMTTDCSLNYKFKTWKFQAQTLGEHVVYRNCFWYSEQFLYKQHVLPHVLQKEELLMKIYLYVTFSRILIRHFQKPLLEPKEYIKCLNDLKNALTPLWSALVSLKTSSWKKIALPGNWVARYASWNQGV